MPDLFSVGSSNAVGVPAETDDRKTVYNASGSTAYYKATSDVSTSDTALTVGSSATFEAQTFLISAGTSNVIVYDAADDQSFDDITADVITPGGGVVPISQQSCVYNQLPTAATSGTDTAFADGTLFLTSVFVPFTFTVTGIGFLVGSVGGTDKVVARLYSSAGVLLASSTTTASGTTAGTAAQTQEIALTATYSAPGPQRYFVGISANGNTAKLRTLPAYTGGKLFTGSVSLTHAATTAVTVPSAFAADKGPYVYLY